MRFSAAWIAFAALVAAAPRPPLGPGPVGRGASHETTRCWTSWDRSPGPCKTTYRTVHTPCTRTHTQTSTITATRARSTTTATTTVTVTATTSTETDLSTATETDTTTTTATATTTVTTTTSTTIATTTVPTPAGFIAIRTTLPEASYEGSGGTDPVTKRGMPVPGVSLNRSPGPFGKGGPTYPRGVTCYTWCQGECKAVTTTVRTTVTCPASTVTSTSTVSTTRYPSATTTVTTTHTTTTTASTTSTTTTTTSTVATSTTTLYAACATDNLADNVNGVAIGDLQGGFVNGQPTTTADSAYDCCVAAWAYTGTTAFAFFPSDDNYCVAYTRNTCTAGQAGDQWTADLDDNGFGQITVGNGPCGEFTSVS